MRSTVHSTDTNCESTVYHAESDQSLSEAVIDAVASATDVDQLELADEFGPLYDAVDPTALDTLFRSGRTTCGTVTFRYAGYEITADEIGTVVVSS